MSTFTRQETRSLLRLMLPILATQLAQMGMGTIDTIMSGHVSTLDLAAVAIGTSIWLPAWLFLGGILVALSPVAAGLSGAGQHRDLPTLLGSAITLGAGMGVVLAVILVLAAGAMPWLIDDSTTAAIASGYLLAIAAGFPLVGIFLALRFYYEATGQAHRVTIVMLSGLLLNIPANALFVYGWFGLPALGGIGCGIGSSLVFTLMAAVLWMDARAKLLPQGVSLARVVRRPHWPRVAELLRIGVPIGGAIFFEVSLFTVIALFLTSLGAETVAGHQVALNLSSITFMIPLSMGMAITVRTGHYLGKQDAVATAATAWLGIRLNLLVALLNATLLMSLSKPIAALYSPDPVVVSIAADLLLFAAIFQLSDATQVAAAGALRGYRDTLAVMLITFSAYWLAGLGLGYAMAFESPLAARLGLGGARGFWVGLILGLTLAAIALIWRLRLIAARHRAALQSI